MHVITRGILVVYWVLCANVVVLEWGSLVYLASSKTVLSISFSCSGTYRYRLRREIQVPGTGAEETMRFTVRLHNVNLNSFLAVFWLLHSFNTCHFGDIWHIVVVTTTTTTTTSNGQRILTRGRIARDFSLGRFNVTLDCFCGRSIGTLVNSMQEYPDVITQKVFHPMGDLDPI